MVGHGYQLPWWLMGAALIAVHTTRAVATRRTTAVRWMARRGLDADERSIDHVRRHLLRLRWSRAVAAVALVAVCGLSLAWARTAVSFLSLPFLLSILAAEALVPEPRRARVRVAALHRRSRAYFAPPRAVLASRLALAVGLLLSLAAAAVGTGRWQTTAFVHAVVLVVGAVALEACLARISTRPLPDRQPDLSVDTALRVASARSATAAGLLFGFFGLTLGLSLVVAATPGPPSWASFVLSQVLVYTLMGVAAVALALVQPLRAWHPHERP